MGSSIPAQWRQAAGHFSNILRKLVDHRGIEAEAELIQALGAQRLLALYKGEEPRLGEFIEAARILNVPLSTFQLHEPGAFPELEIAYAELLYAASRMDAAERTRLAEAMAALPASLAKPKLPEEADHPKLPESLLSALRRASE